MISFQEPSISPLQKSRKSTRWITWHARGLKPQLNENLNAWKAVLPNKIYNHTPISKKICQMKKVKQPWSIEHGSFQKHCGKLWLPCNVYMCLKYSVHRDVKTSYALLNNFMPKFVAFFVVQNSLEFFRIFSLENSENLLCKIVTPLSQFYFMSW